MQGPKHVKLIGLRSWSFVFLFVIQARPCNKFSVTTCLQEGFVCRLQTASTQVRLCCRCNILRG